MRGLGLFSCLTSLLAAAPLQFVSAADIAVKALPQSLPVANWSGFYVGVNVGAGQDLGTTNEAWSWATTYPTGTLMGINGGSLAATTAPQTFTTNFSDQHRHAGLGAIGGLEAGHNWQQGRVVFGIEGDVSLSSQSSAANYSAQPVHAQFPPLPNFWFVPGTNQGWSSSEKIEWLTTLRGRVGLAQDSSLWYVTGGVAGARIGSSYTLLSSPGVAGLSTASGTNGAGSFAQWGLPGGIATAHYGTTRIGWVVGGGVETALNRLLGWGASNWTAKVEYLFADLGTVSNSIGTGLVPVCATTCANPAVGATSFTSSTHVYEQILRVGLNYKLGAPAPPAPRS